jgi:hypothetical protein
MMSSRILHQHAGTSRDRSFLSSKYPSEVRERSLSYNMGISTESDPYDEPNANRTSQLARRTTLTVVVGFPITSVIGPYGLKAAKDRAALVKLRWNGMGCLRQKVFDRGKYSFATTLGPLNCSGAIAPSECSHCRESTKPRLDGEHSSGGGNEEAGFVRG